MNRESEFHGRVGLVIARTNDELLVGYEQSHLWDQAYGEELEEPRYLLPMSAFRREKAA